MRKPLFVLITDMHIADYNRDEVKSVIIQAIDKAIELGLSHVVCAGDVFTERKNQTLAVLDVWGEILDYCTTKDIELVAIPGNHDKVDYTSEKSYLDSFKYHPNFWLIRDCDDWDLVEGVRLHFVPFFDEKNTYSQYLSKCNLLKDGINYLITHVAVNGVRNNDGSEVEGACTVSSFNQFTKVFIGHYHDKQQVGNNIFYIGSIMQKTYGEDESKGMTVVYDDGDHEQVELKSRKFKTIEIDIDSVDTKLLNKLTVKYADHEDNIRFKFKGDREKLNALDRRKFEDVGIDTDFKYAEVEVDVSYKEATNFSGFDKKKIKKEWKEFSEQHELDHDTGINYLNKI